MKTLIRPAVSLLLLLSMVTGVIYPFLVTGIGQLLFPRQVTGSLIEQNGQWVGSSLIGQHFTDPKYFWGRLSATASYPYNSTASGGSNFGPLNPALLAAVTARIAALREVDPDNPLPIPVDLVTASASGLDPHISPAAAVYQLERIAKLRQLAPDQVLALVHQHTEAPQLEFLGEYRVNVLRLNLALDRLSGDASNRLSPP
jgi:K+-transporting ATPase ATPase C chain